MSRSLGFALAVLIGLFMASRALDNEIYVFGLALAAFAVLFVLGQIRRHFNEAARVVAGAAEGGDNA